VTDGIAIIIYVTSEATAGAGSVLYKRMGRGDISIRRDTACRVKCQLAHWKAQSSDCKRWRAELAARKSERSRNLIDALKK
jgi:hypothetical protein